ncbi:MAG: hypothetical protein ACJATT_002987 [Myxococcota bacterium]|jgi:hypothetical protein
MNYQKAVGVSTQAIGAVAQVSGALAIASGGVDVIAGLLCMAKSASRKHDLGKARDALRVARAAALMAQQEVHMRGNTADEQSDIANHARSLAMHRVAAAAAAHDKRVATTDPALSAPLGDEEDRNYRHMDTVTATIARVKAEPAVRAAQVQALLTEFTTLESVPKMVSGGDYTFDALKKMHNRSLEKAALHAAQGTQSVVSGAFILSGVGAAVAIGLSALNGLITVGGMVVDYCGNSKADTLMSLAGCMDDAGMVSGAESKREAAYHLMEKRLTKSDYRYYDHSIAQERALGFTNDEWDGVRKVVPADKTSGKKGMSPNRLRVEGRKEGDATETLCVILESEHEEQTRAD